MHPDSEEDVRAKIAIPRVVGIRGVGAAKARVRMDYRTLNFTQTNWDKGSRYHGRQNPGQASRRMKTEGDRRQKSPARKGATSLRG